MEIVENSLEVPIGEFLNRPLFCFLAQVTADGEPRISPLWFLWEDEQVWCIADTVGKSYAGRVAQRPETAVAVVDFEVQTGRVEHVGMRGQATLVALEEERVSRLLRRYLGENEREWDVRFADLDPDRWSFIRFDPDSVVARDQSFSPSLG